MAQMCLGLSGGFGPMIRPWFQGTRVVVGCAIAMVSFFEEPITFVPFVLGRESLSRANELNRSRGRVVLQLRG